MSVDSQLLVQCNKEDMLEIGKAVTKALSKYSREKLDQYWQNNTDAVSRMNFMFSNEYKESRKMFTNGASINSYNFESFTFNFGIGDDLRRSLFMTATDDYSYICEGFKVFFSIGYWGSSDEIMKVVADAMRGFGDVYFNYNDCDERGFIKIN